MKFVQTRRSDMRIMCLLVSLTIVLALNFGCSVVEEKHGRTKPKREKVEPERKKVEPEVEKVKTFHKKAKVEKPKRTFPVLRSIRKRLLKRLGLAHLKEEQARELFKKLTPLIRQMHRLEKQINKLEMKARILMKQSRAEDSKVDKGIHVLRRKLKNKKLTVAEHRQIKTKFKELNRRLKVAETKDMDATMLRIEKTTLKVSLELLEKQVQSILATYRKKKRNTRTNL